MTDLETRLREDAQRAPRSTHDDLSERIIARLPQADAGPLPMPSRSHWPWAVAAAVLIAGFLAIAVRAGAPAPQPSPTAALPAAPERIALPAINWTAPWQLDVGAPLDGELAHLGADLRGASRFLADRLPSLGTREVN